MSCIICKVGTIHVSLTLTFQWQLLIYWDFTFCVFLPPVFLTSPFLEDISGVQRISISLTPGCLPYGSEAPRLGGLAESQK